MVVIGYKSWRLGEGGIAGRGLRGKMIESEKERGEAWVTNEQVEGLGVLMVISLCRCIFSVAY